MSAITSRVIPRTRNEPPDTRNRNKYLLIFLFTAPGMLFFFLFLLYPVSNSLYYSLFDWNGFGPPTDYIGMGNYDRLLNHNVFQMSVQHSLLIVFLSVVVQLPMALGLALLVGRGALPGRSFFRTVLFIPYVFSEILSAYIWMYVFHPRDGLMNVILDGIIPNYQNIVWLADRHIVLYAIFGVITWKFFGLHMILYMAALQGVPKDLEEAARIDGANEWQVLRRVTIPMIGPALRLTVYLSVLGSFQQFVLVWVLTEGGPANASHLLATYLYRYGIIGVKLGYGSAIAVILFVITLTFSLLYQYFIMGKDYVETT